MQQPISHTKNLPVHDDFLAGIDAGGTKVNIVDTVSSNIHHFPAPDYPNLDRVLEEYFLRVGSRPRKVVIAIGGLRDDETGNVQVTNVNWPIFSPGEASQRFPGTSFETVHDLAGTASGALHASSVDLHALKTGTARNNGPIIAVTIGTGVGVCAVIRDPKTNGQIFFSGEPGHVGFQPYTEAERRHLAHLYKKFEHPSVELAINGKHGVVAWVEHSPEIQKAGELKQALDRANVAGRPPGAVLLEFATEGSGVDREAAHAVLNNMGSLVGNVLADFALSFRSTGGIYMTGSVSLGLSEYWAEHTGFTKAFIRRGTPDHAAWLENMLLDIPIYLLTDSYVSAKGALALAKET